MDFSKAIELKPNFAAAYGNRGYLYGIRGLLDQALEDAAKAIEINPRAARNYNNRAIIYFLRKEYDKSQQDVLKAQALGFTASSQLLEELKKVSGGNG